MHDMQSSLSRFPDHPSRSKLRGIHFKINKKIRYYLISLPRSHQEQIAKLIDKLSENPFPSKARFVSLSSTNNDIKKCKGHPARFRARIGEYRLIYQIEESQVLILKLDTRGDVY